MTEQISEEDVIWEATIDGGTWRAKVTRVTDGQGELTVTNLHNDEVILTEVVGLMYGAIFGPDVDDLRMWQHMSIEAVDHYYAQNKEKM